MASAPNERRFGTAARPYAPTCTPDSLWIGIGSCYPALRRMVRSAHAPASAAPMTDLSAPVTVGLIAEAQRSRWRVDAELSSSRRGRFHVAVEVHLVAGLENQRSGARAIEAFTRLRILFATLLYENVGMSYQSLESYASSSLPASVTHDPGMKARRPRVAVREQAQDLRLGSHGDGSTVCRAPCRADSRPGPAQRNRAPPSSPDRPGRTRR